uniref:Uncharacterized protein n=1 Tax=Cacopsylla melanoneura TaxID=428564 RepID=A0A8D9ADQ1_9HEMI
MFQSCDFIALFVRPLSFGLWTLSFSLFCFIINNINPLTTIILMLRFFFHFVSFHAFVYTLLPIYTLAIIFISLFYLRLSIELRCFFFLLFSLKELESTRKYYSCNLLFNN